MIGTENGTVSPVTLVLVTATVPEKIIVRQVTGETAVVTTVLVGMMEIPVYFQVGWNKMSRAESLGLRTLMYMPDRMIARPGKLYIKKDNVLSTAGMNLNASGHSVPLIGDTRYGHIRAGQILRCAKLCDRTSGSARPSENFQSAAKK